MNAKEIIKSCQVNLDKAVEEQDKQEVDQTVKSDVTVKADVKQITAEMDAKTATELYQDMMKGD